MRDTRKTERIELEHLILKKSLPFHGIVDRILSGL
jgi:hypothetical protein